MNPQSQRVNPTQTANDGQAYNHDMHQAQAANPYNMQEQDQQQTNGRHVNGNYNGYQTNDGRMSQTMNGFKSQDNGGYGYNSNQRGPVQNLPVVGNLAGEQGSVINRPPVVINEYAPPQQVQVNIPGRNYTAAPQRPAMQTGGKQACCC